MMYLSGSGCSPATHPGLWEYLSRRAHVAKEHAIAHKVRQEMWDAGLRSQDLAFREAGHFLDQGNPGSAQFVVESVFGDDPNNAQARHLLSRAHLGLAQEDTGRSRLRTQRDIALKMNEGYEVQTPEDAATIIDLLRFCQALDLASIRNAEAQAQFPGNPLFTLREARILEQQRDPAGAIAIWEDVAETVPGSRTEALFKLHQLNTFLGNHDAANAAAAQLALQDLSLVDRLRLAIATDQRGMIGALARLAAIGGLSSEALGHASGAAFTDLLLDNGDLGLVVWLRRKRVALSDASKAVVEGCGFGQVPTRTLPDTFSEAERIRSPDFMLPLNEYMQKPRRPKGWPGTRHKVERLLLANGTLGGGGAERQFVELVRALLASGVSADQVDCAFFSLEAERQFDRFLPDLAALGVRIHDLGAREVVNRNLPSQVSSVIEALPFELRADVLALWYLVAELRPLTIHGWQDRAGLAAGLVGELADTERVVMSARNMSPQVRADKRLMGYRNLYRDFVAHENYHMTANAALGAGDYSRWIGCASDKITLLQNTVDTSRFNPALVAQKSKDSDERLRIGGLFRLAANKRPLLWLDTIAILQEHLPITPVLRGRGPMLREVTEAAERLGLTNLIIETDLSTPEQLYSDLDAVLLMSQVEGVPNILLEAQACGLPVIATDVGGVAEAMPQRGRAAGLLLPETPKPEAAARAIAEWLPGALQQPGQVRAAFVERKFGAKALARAATDLYLGRGQS